jgi:hypothetical protein
VAGAPRSRPFLREQGTRLEDLLHFNQRNRLLDGSDPAGFVLLISPTRDCINIAGYRRWGAARASGIEAVAVVLVR